MSGVQFRADLRQEEGGQEEFDRDLGDLFGGGRVEEFEVGGEGAVAYDEEDGEGGL